MVESSTDGDGRLVVQDDAQASWCLRKIAALEAEQAKRAAYVQGEIERLQAWQAQEDSKAQRSLEYFTALLRGYVDLLKAQGVLTQHKRSYKLPQGTLQLRTAPIEYERDDAKLLEWARPLGLIRTTEKVAWDLVKEMVEPESEQAFAPVRDKITKQPIAGIIVKQPSREIFSVKIEGE
jgi:hypothetical protein